MKNKRLKIFLIALSVCAAIGCIAAGTAYYYLLHPQFHPETTSYIYIDHDDTLDSIYSKVKEEGNPDVFGGFKWLMKYKKYGNRILTGKYEIRPSDNAYRLYQRLAGGQQTPVKLVVGSVRTLDRLAETVSAQLMIVPSDIASRLSDPQYVASLGYTEETLYAFFLPNTYEVYWNISVDELFKRLQKEHQRFWSSERLAKAEGIGLTPTEVSTLASIVDEETNNNSEKPVVAGLYLNRLRQGMPLQADPTVKFALGDFEARRVTNAMLATDSPYNTYKYAGLPPGPIRVPTLRAIDGVLNYTKHNYLYMCAKEDFSGAHNFANSLSEHNENARKYHRALNERNIFK